MLGRPTAPEVGQVELLAGGRRTPHHPVRTKPAKDLDGQPSQQVGEARGVVSGVEHDQDRRVTRPPLAGGNEPFDDLTDLHGGHCGDVGAGLQASPCADGTATPPW